MKVLVSWFLSVFYNIINYIYNILVIVDIKPANMEELTEVITAAEFHPQHCNIFAYSTSKGAVKLCDMREAALCDQYSKSRFIILSQYFY